MKIIYCISIYLHIVDFESFQHMAVGVLKICEILNLTMKIILILGMVNCLKKLQSILAMLEIGLAVFLMHHFPKAQPWLVFGGQQYIIQLEKWPYEKEGGNLRERALRKKTKESSREQITEREK